jgi:hypothetical protein
MEVGAMKKSFVFLALSALTLAAPVSAERIYVPVWETAASGGDIVATRVRAGGEVLADLSPAKRGLISLDAEEPFEVSAWTVDRAGREIAEVPVFSDAEAYTAGLEVPLDRLSRPGAVASLQVGAANLSEQTASCKATLFARNGSPLAEIPFEVEPMSMARKDGFAAAGRGRVSEIRVTCDQSFYPFAATAGAGGLNPSIAKGVGPNGACDVFQPLIRQTDGTYFMEVKGTFHTTSKTDPKGIICVKVGTELHIGKAVYEWDVTAGPWSTRDKSGLHNLAYFFLDRYRGGTVGNINQAGPNKSFLKFMQNVGMAPGTNTNVKAGYAMQTNATYHVVYTFDAHNKSATLQLLQNGLEVKKISKETKPGNNQTLVVDPFGSGNLAGLGMICEFGNYFGQHHPEEAAVNWKYSNFKLRLDPK